MKPGEQIVLVLVASAIEAMHLLPVNSSWITENRRALLEKEESDEGASWVDARESDDVARQGWQQPPNPRLKFCSLETSYNSPNLIIR